MVAKASADIAEVQARLAKLDGGNVQVALAAFGSVILNRIRMGFRLGRSPWGVTWTPLNTELTRTGSPLRHTGRLQRSITMAQGANEITIGTNLIQAKVHQFGAVIKPKPGPGKTYRGRLLAWAGPGGAMFFAKQVTIPARPYMPMDKSGTPDLPPQWAETGLDAMKKALQL